MTPAAGTPPKLTVEPLWNPTPEIVTTRPGAADAGEKAVTDSDGAKDVLLVTLFIGVVIAIGPAGAPFGTVASILVGERTRKLALTPANWTFVAPLKAVPLIVTVLPVAPDVGVKLAIAGTLETTTAVGGDTEGVPAPEALLALSCTRIVRPTSAAGTV